MTEDSSQLESKIVVQAKADFETAISSAGFGKFNFLLILAAACSVLFHLHETSSLSYVFSVAQCDLHLSLENKGILNGITFAGMITSAFFWGSLIDVVGRRKVLIFAHLCDCAFVLLASFSSNFAMLLCAKFFSGILINGSSNALGPYLSEFHASNYRSRVPLAIGLFFSAGNILVTLLAWFILGLDLRFRITNTFEFHAWNLFLFIGILPTICSGILFFLLPETPKYLMTKQQNEEALKVFKKIYSLNTGNAKDSYPVNKLIEEQQVRIRQGKSAVKDAWLQISPLFSKKHSLNLALVCLLQLLCMTCLNMLRLWYPQIFQTISEYKHLNNKTESFCGMLNHMFQKTDDSNDCFIEADYSSVYINFIILSTAQLCGYISATCLISTMGKKKILGVLGILTGLSAVSIYFAPDSTTAIALMCIYFTCNCINIDVIITIVIAIFPTSLRGSALSLSMMSGRIGGLAGNLLFSYLVQINCGAPFFTIGALTLVGIAISFLLPNPDMKTFE